MASMSFAGKTVVLTGASAGIGEALAVALAGRGASLVLGARTAEALESCARRCVEAGGKALAVPADVADPAACKRLIERAVEAFGGVDALVNNAGISMRARLEDVQDLTIYERIMRVNYLGAVHCTAHALPHLKKSGGLVVAVSSLMGLFAAPTRTGYCASKHAMQGFFDALRIELAGSGVDVLVVNPGIVATEIRARSLGAGGASLGAASKASAHGDAAMSVGECVRLIVEGMEARKREVVMTAGGKAARFLKLVAPGWLDRMTARTMAREE